MQVSVVILDPTPAFRAGLGRAFEEADHQPIQVDDVGRWVESEEAGAVLITVRDVDDESLVQALRRQRRDTPIVALLPDPTPDAYHRVLRAGADAAVGRDDEPDHIVSVTQEAVAGRSILPALVVRGLARSSRQLPVPVRLTDRNNLYLQLLAEGCTLTAIARQVDRSPRTVQRDLQKLYRRIGVTNSHQAVTWAARAGILNADNGDDDRPV